VRGERMKHEAPAPARPSFLTVVVPRLSIVVPTYNRRASLGRCLASILSQADDTCELVVVDDGSTDDTVGLVGSLEGQGVRLVRHVHNRGVCAARNTGVLVARGPWILYVDSDWELLPGAVRDVLDLTAAAPGDVGAVGGYTQNDAGERWPVAPFPDGPFGFEAYLRWAEACQGAGSDWLACHRREVYSELEWPTDGRLETQFHMRLAKRWRLWVKEAVLSVEHTDCEDRYCAPRTASAIARWLRIAPFQARMWDEVLEEFGAELRRYAPRLRTSVLRSAAEASVAAGDRGRAVLRLAELLATGGARAETVVLCGGLLTGPRVMGYVKRSAGLRRLVRKLRDGLGRG
jgi:glycosyltransferase involved in cell wall biosynthesis